MDDVDPLADAVGHHAQAEADHVEQRQRHMAGATAGAEAHIDIAAGLAFEFALERAHDAIDAALAGGARRGRDQDMQELGVEMGRSSMMPSG